MAAELVTPVDPLTGTVLPIIPNPELEFTSRTAALFSRHHSTHNKPENVTDGDAERADWDSQIQVVENTLHNSEEWSYHSHYDGPERNLDKRILLPKLILGSLAGYISDWGIDINPDGPYRRPMTEAEQLFLRQPSPNGPLPYQYIRYGVGPVLGFVSDQIVETAVSQVDDRSRDIMLTSPDDPCRQLGVAGQWLAISVETIASDVRPLYSRLWGEGRLHPDAPEDPAELIRASLRYKEASKGMMTDLIDRLQPEDQAAAA